MKILLAIDGSTASEAALASVASRPWPAGTAVRLITVATLWKDEIAPTVETSVYDQVNSHLQADATQLLYKSAEKLKREAPNLSVATLLRVGSPKHEILSEAQRWDADLIVVGSHGRGALQRFFLGSVSLAIATNAACSVEIVRDKATPLTYESP